MDTAAIAESCRSGHGMRRPLSTQAGKQLILFKNNLLHSFVEAFLNR